MKIYFFLVCYVFFLSKTNINYNEKHKIAVNAIIIKKTDKNLFTEITITNLTADTVRHRELVCNWEENYLTNSKKWEINYNTLCYKNGYIIVKIPPYESITKKLLLNKNILYKKAGKNSFNIGFIFSEIKKGENLNDKIISNSKANIVWSNLVSEY